MPRLRSLLPLLAAVSACSTSPAPARPAPNLDLGAFSMSLAVKDLAASREFYGKLGFAPTAGDGVSWQVLRNGDHVIGLFQGMFPRNMLTFNPGWNQQAQPVAPFTDVRGLQALLQQRGLKLDATADAAGTGPASVVLTDPDGNPILIDQHVPMAR
jgi:lactoylglutathione lyase